MMYKPDTVPLLALLTSRGIFGVECRVKIFAKY
jgi:hypothetical protein